ncbi:MAG: BatA domain-containing protein, partial [Phycisphaerales bacterium]|nr:BatA domain-containing protein [Phycisphaerales bacterium]
MSWPNFLAPGWGLMGLLAVPLVLLYILRQKRPDTPISSTLLWSKTLADMRASTPFQKLRRHLLLLLQLLILAALVFTLMRPVVQAKASQTRAGVIVIDATASMQTTDNGEMGGGARLDRAKTEAKKLIDAMRPGDRYKLIADGGGLNRAGYDFITSKAELRSLIDAIKASDSHSDLSESLILAAESLRAINAGGESRDGNPGPSLASKVWLFSDGAGIKVPNVMGVDGDLLQFVKIGESSRSVGITQLAIAPVPKEPKTYQVFVGLKNAWETPRKVAVLLAHGHKDNFLNIVQSADLPAGGQGSVVFEKVVVEPGKLFVRVDDTDDDFPLDNIAYGIIEPPRKIKVVLVTPKNLFLEQFLKTEARVSQVEASTVSPEHYVPGTGADLADLVILDGVLPAQLPKVDTLLIAPPPHSIAKATGDVAGFKITQEM